MPQCRCRGRCNLSFVLSSLDAKERMLFAVTATSTRKIVCSAIFYMGVSRMVVNVPSHGSAPTQHNTMNHGPSNAAFQKEASQHSYTFNAAHRKPTMGCNATIEEIMKVGCGVGSLVFCMCPKTCNNASVIYSFKDTP